MMSDGFVTLTCDKCNHNEDFEMTALARGSYDTRDVRRRAEREGWIWQSDDSHVCESCIPDEED